MAGLSIDTTSISRLLLSPPVCTWHHFSLTGPGSGQSKNDNDIVYDKDDVIIDNNNKNNVKKNTTNNDHANHDRALSTLLGCRPFLSPILICTRWANFVRLDSSESKRFFAFS